MRAAEADLAALEIQVEIREIESEQQIRSLKWKLKRLEDSLADKDTEMDEWRQEQRAIHNDTKLREAELNSKIRNLERQQTGERIIRTSLEESNSSL